MTLAPGSTDQQAAPVPTTVPTQVGVLGGGRMGAGIAHAFLVAGAHVTVVERDADSAAAARERVLGAVDTALRLGAIQGERSSYADRLSVATDASAFAGAGLVVEAVPEVVALKTEALRSVEAQLAPDAWLASNTSSLPITELARVLERPDRFIGLHFFNPVPVSTLIEVVTGEATSPELVDLAAGWVSALGKTPILVRDSPGFASSRLGVAIALEAIRMVEEGVASPADIDAAMVLGYKHPVGPLRTTDLVGLDVRLGIAEHLHSTLGERFAPPQLLRDLVARGDLGRKSGQGFFDWKDAS